MAMSSEASGASAATTRTAFLRGFLVRLLYGVLGFAVVIFIRPDFLGEKLHLLVGSVAAYLLVCLVGGAFDAAGRKGTSTPSLRRPAAARTLAVAAAVVAILVLWLDR